MRNVNCCQFYITLVVVICVFSILLLIADGCSFIRCICCYPYDLTDTFRSGLTLQRPILAFAEPTTGLTFLTTFVIPDSTFIIRESPNHTQFKGGTRPTIDGKAVTTILFSVASSCNVTISGVQQLKFGSELQLQWWKSPQSWT